MSSFPQSVSGNPGLLFLLCPINTFGHDENFVFLVHSAFALIGDCLPIASIDLGIHLAVK